MPPSPQRRPATAADVAARAGVSRATVSHIFNGRADSFATTTRERVLHAAGELDYRPSPAGRDLVRGRSDTIIVLVPQSTIGQNHQDAVDRLTKGTTDLGANVVLRFADEEAAATVSAVLRMRPLAVVDLGASLPPDACDRLRANGVPTVPRAPESSDEGEGLEHQIAEAQVRELVGRGPRPIVYAALEDVRPDPWSPSRLRAIRDVCVREGLAVPSTVRVPLDRTKALAAVRAVVGGRPVGVAAFNDTAAFAVLSVIAALGLSVPSDVSIAGVDNTPLSKLLTPRLTTVDVDIDALMDHAVAQLKEELGLSTGTTPTSSSRPVTLVRGETT